MPYDKKTAEETAQKIESYKIKIIDTYIDKNTGLLAKNFGKVLRVPEDVSDERAKSWIQLKIAKVVKDDVQAKTDKKSENKDKR